MRVTRAGLQVCCSKDWVLLSSETREYVKGRMRDSALPCHLALRGKEKEGNSLLKEFNKTVGATLKLNVLK